MGLFFSQRSEAKAARYILVPITLIWGGVTVLVGVVGQGDPTVALAGAIVMASAVFPWYLSRFTDRRLRYVARTMLILSAWLVVLGVAAVAFVA